MTLYMQTVIKKWGNSQAIRLPQVILDILLLQENDPVEITTNEDSIIIKKATRKRRAKKSIKDRFKNWDGGSYKLNDEDKALLCMEPVGEEVWK